jgi:hypothetical protein
LNQTRDGVSDRELEASINRKPYIDTANLAGPNTPIFTALEAIPPAIPVVAIVEACWRRDYNGWKRCEKNDEIVYEHNEKCAGRSKTKSQTLTVWPMMRM